MADIISKFDSSIEIIPSPKSYKESSFSIKQLPIKAKIGLLFVCPVENQINNKVIDLVILASIVAQFIV